MKQLFGSINEKETIFEVRKFLYKYRIKKLAAFDDYVPRITSNFTLDTFKTANVATTVVRKVDTEREHATYFDYLNHGLSELYLTERQIIVMSFLADEPYFTYQIAAQLNISERQFFRMKKTALLKLGLALNLAVLKEPHLTEKGGEKYE